MVARVPLKKKIVEGGNYFTAPKDNIEFISTGCKTLDLALGGGWAEGRVFNIVGDKSTGKTLQCIEAGANFIMKYPKRGRVKYREAESAFDEAYAQALGFPLDRVDRGDGAMDTVEDMFEDLDHEINRKNASKEPLLYIVDSLDSLSDRGELSRAIDDPSYGMEKAKVISQGFRRLVRKITEANITLGIVSQVRTNVGAGLYQRKTTRAGGKALDFYATHVLYLTQTGRLMRTVHGIKRPTGVKIKAKVDKNKVGLPYREADYAISFGYGIEDGWACLEFLKVAGGLKDLGIKPDEIKDYGANCTRSELAEIHAVTERRWFELEKEFVPTRRKYEPEPEAEEDE